MTENTATATLVEDNDQPTYPNTDVTERMIDAAINAQLTRAIIVPKGGSMQREVMKNAIRAALRSRPEFANNSPVTDEYPLDTKAFDGEDVSWKKIRGGWKSKISGDLWSTDDIVGDTGSLTAYFVPKVYWG